MNPLQYLVDRLREEACKEIETARTARSGDGDGDPEYARIICPMHGPQFISEREYEDQLMRPNARWECTAWCTEPASMIGPCGAACNFDDEHFESKHLCEE